MVSYKTIGLLTSWNLESYEGIYYANNMHFVYIDYLCRNNEKVVLFSSCRKVSGKPVCEPLNMFSNLKIVELPYTSSYVSSQLNVAAYYRALKKHLKDVEVLYCRTPDPFCWMPALLFKCRVIMDFVGDTIDCTRNNENWSGLKKNLMIAGYYPDYILTLLAAKKSKVITAGQKLSTKLRKYGIKATSLIPSTVLASQMAVELPSLSPDKTVRLIYVGYIRNAKGISTIMNLCLLLKENNIRFVFDIIGTGEMYGELKDFIRNKGLEENVILHGHINDRDRINDLLKNSDIFFFPSLSEGAPRVVIEAMSQGIPVVSTPVGSLPYTFNDGDTIRYFDYHNAAQAFDIIKEYTDDKIPFIRMRDKAYKEVKEKYTLEAFLSQVFNYET
jgi:glycosyltransferase